MNTRSLLGVCVLVVLSVTEGSSVAVRSLMRQQQEWHTQPDRWTEPRHFQTPFDPAYANYLSVTRQAVEDNRPATRVFSPNKAYWLGSRGPLPSRFTPATPILVFNERPYLIRIAPAKNDPDYFVKRLEWVNEKLVYIEIWWGNVVGSCYILDVETELMVYREMVNDGSLPFQQWKRK